MAVFASGTGYLDPVTVAVDVQKPDGSAVETSIYPAVGWRREVAAVLTTTAEPHYFYSIDSLDQAGLWEFMIKADGPGVSHWRQYHRFMVNAAWSTSAR
jgi:hypothetical protein